MFLHIVSLFSKVFSIKKADKSGAVLASPASGGRC